MPHSQLLPHYRYFSKRDVSMHNHEHDCWVSVYDKVVDLTSLLEENKGNVLCKPIIDMAGKDVTCWFKNPKELKTRVDETTGLEVPVCPQGRFLHVPPETPSTEYRADIENPWWTDNQYVVGFLSKDERKVNFRNTLTGAEDVIEVSGEERLFEIQERMKTQINTHSSGYIWRYNGKKLDMYKTLDENGIVARTADLAKAGMNENNWIPVINMVFADDLTVE